jgi:hypothetical protein
MTFTADAAANSCHGFLASADEALKPLEQASRGIGAQTRDFLLLFRCECPMAKPRVLRGQQRFQYAYHATA